MELFDTTGEQPESRQRSVEQSEVAALAAKIARLPHDGTLLTQRTATDIRQGATIVRRARGHGWLWWMCYLLAGSVMLGLGVVAALRIFYHDGTFYLTWINAFTRYVYLPAYLCLVWAGWQRRWILALGSLAVVVCHLTWMAPTVIPDRRFVLPPAAEAAAVAPPVRIFFANVLQTNQEHDAMLKEIAAAKPDVIVLAEWGWRWHRAFQQSPLAADFVHGISLAQPQWGGGVNVFSKLPLTIEMRNWIAGRLVRTADIQLGPHTLRIVALHAPRPMHLTGYDYLGFWNQMIPLLSTETGPLLVIGDFNATEHSLVYQRLKAAGLRSAHDVRGRGYATTWPNDQNFPSLIRIDQAFLSPAVECERIVEGRGRGSDHKPLVVDVRIRESVYRSPPPALAEE